MFGFVNGEFKLLRIILDVDLFGCEWVFVNWFGFWLPKDWSSFVVINGWIKGMKKRYALLKSNDENMNFDQKFK